MCAWISQVAERTEYSSIWVNNHTRPLHRQCRFTVSILFRTACHIFVSNLSNVCISHVFELQLWNLAEILILDMRFLFLLISSCHFCACHVLFLVCTATTIRTQCLKWLIIRLNKNQILTNIAYTGDKIPAIRGNVANMSPTTALGTPLSAACWSFKPK